MQVDSTKQRRGIAYDCLEGGYSSGLTWWP